MTATLTLAGQILSRSKDNFTALGMLNGGHKIDKRFDFVQKKHAGLTECSTAGKFTVLENGRLALNFSVQILHRNSISTHSNLRIHASVLKTLWTKDFLTRRIHRVKQPFECRRTLKTRDFAPDFSFFYVNIAYIVQSEPIPKGSSKEM